MGCEITLKKRLSLHLQTQTDLFATSEWGT